MIHTLPNVSGQSTTKVNNRLNPINLAQHFKTRTLSLKSGGYSGEIWVLWGDLTLCRTNLDAVQVALLVYALMSQYLLTTEEADSMTPEGRKKAASEAAGIIAAQTFVATPKTTTVTIGSRGSTAAELSKPKNTNDPLKAQTPDEYIDRRVRELAGQDQSRTVIAETLTKELGKPITEYRVRKALGKTGK